MHSSKAVHFPALRGSGRLLLRGDAHAFCMIHAHKVEEQVHYATGLREMRHGTHCRLHSRRVADHVENRGTAADANADSGSERRANTKGSGVKVRGKIRDEGGKPIWDLLRYSM